MTQSFDWFFEETTREGRRLAWDVETDGLLDTVSVIHSLVIEDIDTGELWSCCDQKHLWGTTGVDDEGREFRYVSIKVGLKLLEEAAITFGHNIIGYDLMVLKLLVQGFRPKGIHRDTLMLAKMIWPVDSLKTLDFPRWRKGTLPGQLIGAHKLEAWGYRLGLQKGEYSATVKGLNKEFQEHGDIFLIPEAYHPLLVVDEKSPQGRKLYEWAAWCQPMQDYCVVDVKVTVKLLRLIIGHLEGTTKASKGIGWDPRAVKLEADTWQLCLDIEKRGYGYDLESAIKLTSTLKTRQAELEKKLKETFGTWWQPLDDLKKGTKPQRDYSETRTDLPVVTLRRFSEKTGKELKPYVGHPKAHYSKDAAFVRIKWTEFNPKSRQHLGDRLQAVFGWTPVEYGGAKGDQAKVDETTIKAIPEDVLPETLKALILEYLVISKTLGQMADGRKSWNDLCGEDGRLHGRIDPLGTVSHRGAHKDPNLGQVPSVSVEEKKDDAGTVVSKEIIWGWDGGFGAECRSLFRPGRYREGWTQTGTDAAGLELRLLGHYLEPFDGGEFARRVSTPGLDIHAENAKITGLSRSETKTATYACVPLDTLVLTRRGWKRHDELALGEDILTYNQEKDVKEWSPLLEVVHYEDAPVVRIWNNHWFDVRCTPNHRWFAKKRNRNGTKPYMRDTVVTAETLSTEYNIIVNAPFSEEESTPRPNQISLSVDDKHGETNWSEIVMGMDHAQRKAFLAGFLLADGHWKKVTRTWTWNQNTGDISEALHLASYLVSRGAISVHRRTNPLNGRDMTVALLSRKGHVTAQRLTIEDVGREPVFCVRTANESFVMRQGDVITITGNTLYGAGNLKLGQQVGVEDTEVDRWAASPSAKSYVRWARKTFKDFVEPDHKTMAFLGKGADVKKRFLEGIAGLKELQAALAEEAKDGFIQALDGRKLSIRKAHAALNQLLQGGGAIVCKKWLLLMREVLSERGLHEDIDYGYMAWVHDEAQVEHREGLSEEISSASAEAMCRVAAYYDFRGELATDSKSGSNWKDCH